MGIDDVVDAVDAASNRRENCRNPIILILILIIEFNPNVIIGNMNAVLLIFSSITVNPEIDSILELSDRNINC